MYNYRAFDLNIASAIPAHELVPGRSCKPDVVIRLGKLGHFASSPLADYSYEQVDEKTTYISWKGIGTFLVKDRNRIVIDPVVEADEKRLRLYLLGPVFSILLRQRGLLLLHASSVVLNGRALAFVGEHGRGKSTIAASLYTRGQRVLSDDLTAVRFGPDGVMALSGFPWIKLWPDSALALNHNPEELPQLYSQVDKRFLYVSDIFQQGAVPLACIYILAGGERCEVEPLHSHEALIDLVRHTYAPPLLGVDEPPTNFIRCGELAAKVPVRRLKVARDLSNLSMVLRLIESDSALPLLRDG